jgi:phenylalanyl-tRNA synthetase beta chain
MPTITIDKKEFLKGIKKKLTEDQLKDRISMLGTDLESIENDEINVEIFPNRPDMLSAQGFKRAFKSFIGEEVGLKKYEIKKSGFQVLVDKSVKDVRPQTACAIIKNVQFDDNKIKEIIQLQEKLHLTYGRNRKKVAIGIYPLDKITFPVTFRADQPKSIEFIPLGENKKMNGLEILTENKTGKEFAHLLEGYDKFPYFIDADKSVLSMPPIINSNLTGRVDKQTKDLFIECSGNDYEYLSTCLNIIVTSFADMGGEINSLEIINNHKTKISPNLNPLKMDLDVDYINKRLGLELTKPEMIDLLAKMGYGYEKEKLLVPAYRADVMHQVDLCEDLAIAYGYENFAEIIPNVATIGKENEMSKFKNKIRELLIGMKLTEVKNYHLMPLEELNEKMNLNDKIVPLTNSVGDHNNLRQRLIPGLIKTLSKNQHYEYPQNIFEIGTIFNYDKTEDTGIHENENLAISLCHENTDFTEIKQIVEALISTLGLSYNIDECKENFYLKGRSAKIIIDNETIGTLGEINPLVLENWELIMPIASCEINLNKIKKKL